MKISTVVAVLWCVAGLGELWLCRMLYEQYQSPMACWVGGGLFVLCLVGAVAYGCLLRKAERIDATPTNVKIGDHGRA